MIVNDREAIVNILNESIGGAREMVGLNMDGVEVYIFNACNLMLAILISKNVSKREQLVLA